MFTLLQEIKDFLFSFLFPYIFFCKKITVMGKENCSVTIIGTMHWKHFRNSSIWLSIFDELIDYVCPDKIGLEIRKKDIDRQLLCLSPLDMFYISKIAKKKGIYIYPFDYWEEEEFHNVAVAGKNIDFNSIDRNQKMFELISKQLSFNDKHLIFTGYSHVSYFVERLARNGFEKKESSSHCKIQKKNIIDLLVFDSIELKRNVDYLRDYLQQHKKNNQWNRRVRAKLKQIEILIDERSKQDR